MKMLKEENDGLASHAVSAIESGASSSSATSVLSWPPPSHPIHLSFDHAGVNVAAMPYMNQILPEGPWLPQMDSSRTADHLFLRHQSMSQEDSEEQQPSTPRGLAPLKR